ncbi:MAG: DNA polymerase III subunit alpha [uncultured bacterium]|nr:MAG: DNA polymerase III subunit alpha [uncultured bacterium]
MIEDQLVILEGEVGIDDFSHNARIMAREIYTIDHARSRHAKYLQISVDAKKSFDVAAFKNLIAAHLNGNCPIIIRYLHNDAEALIKFGKSWLVKPSDALLTLIQTECAVEKVEVVY